MTSLSMSFSRVCSKYVTRCSHVQKTNYYTHLDRRHMFTQERICSSQCCRTQKRAGSTTAAITSGNLSGVITKQQAKYLAVKLTSEEREILITALQECQSKKIKAELENELAAFRWRSKYGRPSKVPTLGEVDPTGTYCEVPEDWLLRKYADAVPLPSKGQLFKVMAANAIPYIGFGFLDNFVMILAGDRIELLVGTTITISTMAAAAVGNTISDVMGLGSAYYVEKMAHKIGFEPPKLTPMQMNLPVTTVAANTGRVIGVIIGCTLGMAPLLFLH